jgi:hypothetical protein
VDLPLGDVPFIVRADRRCDQIAHIKFTAGMLFRCTVIQWQVRPLSVGG